MNWTREQVSSVLRLYNQTRQTPNLYKCNGVGYKLEGGLDLSEILTS